MWTGKDRVQLEAVGQVVNIGDARVSPGDLVRGDSDGVVVETLAEPGQVVSPGQPVVRLARAGQREAIVLQYYQELSNIDAAALMEISVEALESLLSRGRRALRLALADMAPGASEGDGR